MNELITEIDAQMCCNRCGETKPKTDGYWVRQRGSVSGYFPTCLVCTDKRFKQRNSLRRHKIAGNTYTDARFEDQYSRFTAPRSPSDIVWDDF